MKSRLILIVAMTGWMARTATADAAYPPGGPMIEKLNEIQGYLFDEDFRLTDSLCIELCARHPEEPFWYLLRAVTLMTEMIDQEEVLRPALFHALLDSAEQLAVQQLDSGSSAAGAWCWLIVGHTHGYRSMFASRFGSVVSAYRHGTRAARAYAAGLQLDSTLYDLYAGLGFYHYWKSAPAGILRELGLIRDERTRGMLELRLARDSSIISREFASSGLIWIWLNERQYDSALPAAARMRARYPHADAHLWALARAHLGRAHHDSALPYLTDLRDRIAAQPGNYYNLVQLDWLITRCWEQLREPGLARASAVRLREYIADVPAKTRRKQQHPIAHLQRLSRR